VIATDASWPAEQLGDAMRALAERSGIRTTGARTAIPPRRVIDDPHGAIERWLEAAAEAIGVDAENVSIPYPEVEAGLSRLGPGIVGMRTRTGPRFVAILGRRRRRSVQVLGPDLSVRTIPIEAMRSALCEPIEAEVAEPVDELLEAASVAAPRRERARRALLAQALAQAVVGPCWIVRPPASASIRDLARDAGVGRTIVALVAVHALAYLLFLAGWWLVGAGALAGRIDLGTLLAWALVLLTTVPLRAAETWLQGAIAIRAGRVLKQKLLEGALRLDPDEIRHQGAGQLLGRVLDSQAVEALALGGGITSLVALVELALAAVVLALGAGGGLSVLALAVAVAVLVSLARRFERTLDRWTSARIEMTHDLVERMVGHRTRLVQEHPERWHDGEDEALERYVAVSKSLDSVVAVGLGVVPRAWLALGVAALAPAFLSGSEPSALAVAVGGTLLAHRALASLTSGLSQLATAARSWRNVAEIFRASSRPQAFGEPAAALLAATRSPVIEASDVTFRYPNRGERALRGCTVTVMERDRLLVQGASGSGKSTLAAVLAGLRAPESGVLLLHGLDRPTIGDAGWRQRVVMAPQFHENHVLAGSFAFNLLMGAGWPAPPERVREAESLCRTLDLGPLLDRMPSGLEQTVGEQGWQLSHGERSRLFLARALLQDASLLVLDESFGALDPPTLNRCLRCALSRDAALLVVAHP